MTERIVKPKEFAINPVNEYFSRPIQGYLGDVAFSLRYSTDSPYKQAIESLHRRSNAGEIDTREIFEELSETAVRFNDDELANKLFCHGLPAWHIAEKLIKGFDLSGEYDHRRIYGSGFNRIISEARDFFTDEEYQGVLAYEALYGKDVTYYRDLSETGLRVQTIIALYDFSNKESNREHKKQLDVAVQRALGCLSCDTVTALEEGEKAKLRKIAYYHCDCQILEFLDEDPNLVFLDVYSRIKRTPSDKQGTHYFGALNSLRSFVYSRGHDGSLGEIDPEPLGEFIAKVVDGYNYTAFADFINNHRDIRIIRGLALLVNTREVAASEPGYTLTLDVPVIRGKEVEKFIVSIPWMTSKIVEGMMREYSFRYVRDDLKRIRGLLKQREKVTRSSQQN